MGWRMFYAGEDIGLGLTATEIVTPVDVEMMRYVRNQCREGYAHYNDHISKPAQKAWWKANAGRLIAYLYRNVDGATVGYGLLRQGDDGRWISSVGVLPAHTGRRYGGRITRHIIRQCPADHVYAEARIDNPAARALHCLMDWDVTDKRDGVERYKTHDGVTRSPLPDPMTVEIAA